MQDNQEVALTIELTKYQAEELGIILRKALATDRALSDNAILAAFKTLNQIQ